MTIRRIDPEPITIYLAIAATFTATVAAANYVKTHHRPLPTAIRRKLAGSLAELEDHVVRLRADLDILEDIFSKAEFPNGTGIRLGNGAYLTPEDFNRYMKVSSGVIRRLSEVNKLTLKMEKDASRLDYLEEGPVTNMLGQAQERLDELLNSRDLSIESAWEQLRYIADNLDSAIRELRNQISND
ncbi:MAG: hypothetical protein KME63_08450 [Candidatus Thiodiazotropha sp. (ex Clathrolucina costata)]|nr:hypothetical protein [Candidatus Thiodiazotropha taylori]